MTINSYRPFVSVSVMSSFIVLDFICVHVCVFMILYVFVKTSAKTYKKSKQEVTPFQLVNDNGLNES